MLCFSLATCMEGSDAYKRITKSAPASIQVGDMGVRFIRIRAGLERSHGVGDVPYLANPPHYAMLPRHNSFAGTMIIRMYAAGPHSGLPMDV